ncbi:MAG TPA: hypothetical protein VF774_04880 [Pseudoduganella sp.]|jgi:hypothetical protein
MTALRRMLCAGIAAACCLPVHAHRLDEYLQAVTVNVADDGILLYVRLLPGIAVAPAVWAGIDTDGSGGLSAAEQAAHARQVVADLALQVDGQPVTPAIVSQSYPAWEAASQGLGQISLVLQAGPAPGTGAHHLHLALTHRRDIAVYLVNALLPMHPAITITEQRHSPDQAVFDLGFTRQAAR